MNRQEHLLTLVAEEAVEIAQRATKCLRFGLNEIQPGKVETNAQRLQDELIDLLAVFGMLELKPLGGMEIRIQTKKEKVERFMAYSRGQGCLQ